MKARRFSPLAAIICAQVALAPAMPSLALAADASPFATAAELGNAPSAGAEYITGSVPGAILVRVNLMGAVVKPGIHHVPAHTDLLTFLSLAGGPAPDGRLDEITIKRRIGPNLADERILKVNLEELAQKTGVIVPALEPNDLILVPRDRPPVSNNTMSVLAFTSTLLGLIISTVAVISLTKKSN